MQSFILIHSQKTKRDEYLKSYLDKLAISPFDQSTVAGETSLGIEQVRELQKQLLYKPLKGDKKAIILEHAQTLTIEAQNAMLKILEEPPNHTLFFLSANNIDNFLSTILSRCTLVILPEEQQQLTDEEKLSLDQQVTVLSSQHISDKLALAEKITTTKETTLITWLAKTIQYLREKMLVASENQTFYAKMLTQLQTAYQMLQTTNVSPRLLLEHIFLTI